MSKWKKNYPLLGAISQSTARRPHTGHDLRSLFAYSRNKLYGEYTLLAPTVLKFLLTTASQEEKDLPISLDQQQRRLLQKRAMRE